MGRSHNGKLADFDELYCAYFADIARYASRRCDTVSAFDVVAETFTVAWRRIEEVRDVSVARPWLYGIARRVLANNLRGSRRRHALTERLALEWTTAEHSPSESLEPLRLALGRLSGADREILLLAGLEEMTPGEIAVVLEITPEAARTRLSRARSCLRQELERGVSASAPTGADTQ